MTTLRQAAKQALEALKCSLNDEPYYVKCGLAIIALEKALEEEALQRLTNVQQEMEAAPETYFKELECNPHPKAPHGFARNASHTEDRYVCECEGWDAYDAGYQAGLQQQEPACPECSAEVLYECVVCSKTNYPQQKPITNQWAIREVYFDEDGEPSMHREVKQDPVAWMDREGDLYKMPEIKGWAPPHTMLYTAPPQHQPLTDEQKDILNFLLGASDIDDAWFGDKHPTEKDQFWWRNRLRKAFQEAAHGIGQKK